ncbi:MAG TPA: hypothetical protein VKS01_04440 [Bryobacteraceae bacterium]|nr:hypothetical protein [Bryobacteraceae bacterium]
MIATIAAWFFARTWRGLRVFYNGDDMMNLYEGWKLRPLHLLMANLTPFSKVHRPFGAALYVAILTRSDCTRWRGGSRSSAC